MHGITHLYRQHAVDKQLSVDSNNSSYLEHDAYIQPKTQHDNDESSYYSTNKSITNDSNSITNRLNSMDSRNSSSSNSSSSTTNTTNAKSPNWQDKIIDRLLQHRSSSPQPVPDAQKSVKNHRDSPTNSTNGYTNRGTSYDSCYSNSFKRTPSSKRSIFERAQSPAVYAGSRRSSLTPECQNSPPVGVTVPQHSNGFFPHDLDDIHESQTTDHQYFTHTGACNNRNGDARPTINSIFHRVNAAHTSIDDYNYHVQARSMDSGAGSGAHIFRNRFDNTSFAKSIDQAEISAKASPKDARKASKDKEHGGHHSIQEMLKHIGKKVHIWPRKSHDANSVATSPLNDPQENFRLRSKSLDVSKLSRPNRILEDCGATYKIYDKIVKEGAHMRRASADLEKRRASFGCASRGLRSDGTMDPHHAAILFRDSRGVSLNISYNLCMLQ